MKFVETHAHIYSSKFKDDVDDTIERAKNEFIDKIYMPNIDHTSIDAMLEMEHKYPDYCVPMMGLHPCSVNKDFEKELYIVEEWLNKRDFVAVGEIGIDLYWDKTFLEQQVEAFKIQIEWAKQKDIPVVIHARDSMEEILEVIDEVNDEKLTGVFHCFSGNLDQAKRVVEHGFYLGIGGVATFKNGGLDKVIPDIDLDKLVLETDCPYMAPVPHRGKRNEPAYIPLVASKIAEYKQVKIEQVAEVTTKNAYALFKNNTDKN